MKEEDNDNDNENEDVDLLGIDYDGEVIDFSQSPLKFSNLENNTNNIPPIEGLEENLNTQDFANIDLMVTETPAGFGTNRSNTSKKKKQDDKEKSKFTKPSDKNIMDIQIHSHNTTGSNFNKKEQKEPEELVKTIFTKVFID